MRILYFSRDYTTHDRRFLQKMAESRHEIFYLRLENIGMNYERRELPGGVVPVEWQGGYQPISTPESWLRLMPSLETVINTVKPDLIHAGPVQSCGFMTAIAGFHPFMVMSWGSDILIDSDRDPLWKWLTTYTLQRSDWAVCDCDAVRNKIRQLVSYPNDHIVQFPWGIDFERFTRDSKGTDLTNFLGWENAFIVLSTRSWEKLYGIDTLLQAFHFAYIQNKKLRLILLGHGALAPWVHEFISVNHLVTVIHQPGVISHEQLPDFFRECDLYMSCSTSDGTSISLLEAMAAGLTVVVSDIPGNREWVVQRQNGYLITPGDSSAFGKVILEAATLDKNRRVEMAALNRAIIEQRADWNKNSRKLMSLYDQIETEYTYLNK